MTDDTGYEDAKVVLERIKDHRHRRSFIGKLLFGAASFAILAFIVGAIFVGVTRQQVRDAETARQCIDAGNIWINRACLIAKR